MQGNFQYVAFLRGINVGGDTLVRMADLKKAFEKMGFERVRTVLASGNVVFESTSGDIPALTRTIEPALQTLTKRVIKVLLRNLDDIMKVRLSEPFKGIAETPDIRLYVTFLQGSAGPRFITLPYSSLLKEFTILHATPGEVFSVIDLSKGKGTTDLMNLLTQEFGPDITTRNWNTVLKVLQ
jgi:uncharacterized protein (DUF1697 family)